MRKNILFNLFIVCLILFLSGNLSADIKTVKYNFTDFTEVSVSHGMKVSLSQSDNYLIEIKAEKADLEYLKVEKVGDKLNIYMDKDYFRKKYEILVRIRMPSLTGIGLSGGTTADIKMNVLGKSFEGGLSGGSKLKGNLHCSDIELQLSGGSEINLSGSGENTEISGSGGSIFKMKEFFVADVNASLSGGSQLNITMNGKLNAAQSGGSNIVYYGEAEIVNNASSGGSKITKGS